MAVGQQIVFHRDRDGVRQLRQPAAACFVIGVNNRFADLMFREQQPFRRLVARHIAVVVKVIAAEIGKHGGGERQRRNAMLHQTMRGNLHRRHGRALPYQRIEHLLHINRRSGGVFRRHQTTIKAVADGPHHRAGFAQQARPLRQQLGGGGFTVGAGHAD